MILLPGIDFKNSETFTSNGSASNLGVVANPDGIKTRLIFDVHKYLDFDNRGTHLECVANHINDSFAPLTPFLKANNRLAIFSEIGEISNQSVSIQASRPREESINNSRSSVSISYVKQRLLSTPTQK
jgi:endoglucanase